jgi:hypothetical protein
VGGAHAYLYAPAQAIRIDNDGFLGTPLPPEEPQADNPPNGAIVDYYLANSAAKVTLQILDAQGRVIRHFSSTEKQPPPRPLLPIAERWFPKPQMLETGAGEHRFVWDLASGGSGSGMEDDDDEAGMPAGPRVPPGAYTLRLSVDGTAQEKPLKVAMDPRCACTQAVLDAQYALAGKIYVQLLAGRKAIAELESVASQIGKLNGKDASTPPDLAAAIREAQTKLDAIRGGGSTPGLAEAAAGLGAALRVVEGGDRAAPQSSVTIFDQMSNTAQQKTTAWEQFKKTGLSALNAALARAGREPIKIAAIEEQVHYAMTR